MKAASPIFGTTQTHVVRYTVLISLFLLATGMFANMYRNGSELRANISDGLGNHWISRRITESPIFSFLPRWFLNRWAVSISQQRNASILKNVFEVFEPSLRSFLASVPIIIDSSANTAKSYPAKGYIGVSPDWDNTVLQSEYRAIYERRGMRPEEPVFADRFKTDLLIHEYLHILQLQQGINSRSCYKAISRWYMDPRYGKPGLNSAPSAELHAFATNRTKYILWHQLYNTQHLSDVPQDESWKNMRYVARYRFADKGVEEFAYIGEEILSGGSDSENFIKNGQWSEDDWQKKKTKLSEVSPEVIALYRRVFNPQLTRQKIPN